jgi:hypothetical protein
MGNQIYKLILDTSKATAKKIGNEMALVNGANFMTVYTEKERIKNDLWSKFIRWMLTPKKCLLTDYKDYLLHLDSRDTRFAFSYLGVEIYFKLLKLTCQDRYWQSNEEIQRTLKIWNPSRVEPTDQYPLDKGFISFEGLEWFFSTSAELTDQLKRYSNGLFYLDTQFLNLPRYIRKPGEDDLGCLAIFELTHDGFRFVSLKYKNKTYYRDDTSDEAKYALRALYGGYSLIRTILTHAVSIHLLTSARFVIAIRKSFDITHPLRQVFLPTELMSLNGIARALNTLFCENGVFQKFSPYTFEGLKLLISDYIDLKGDLMPKMAFMNPNGLADYKNWNLDEKEVECLPFKGLNTWFKYIYNFADAYVTEYMRQNPHTPLLRQWAQEGFATFYCDAKTAMVKTIALMYSTQIIHATVADPSLFYIFSGYSYTLRKGFGLINSHALKSTHFMQMVTDESTAHAWVKLNEDLSCNITDLRLRTICRNFYTGIKSLNIDPRCKSILPNSPGCSTGL